MRMPIIKEETSNGKGDENADENKRFGVAIYVKRKKTNLIIV